ncbi:hypothetical protein K437DRAFT_275464 [Tilletiaria anomala UBC 951]|uniref:Uncharacterized protein n=1 Tax=Tilletiaria anomala (strain ATCC 24038 / CBS 436.72 / UBC 951) TaxID=1037660 RepID=A0A066VRM2_TILAU|nr:uncharacterized protein K437DRAFT_275464 [Tilletiaria anomala UBC 951]KDN41444.1 hypothetical protein K437DRAFT_275464 [Tilletiaria anomala UBC 951]
MARDRLAAMRAPQGGGQDGGGYDASHRNGAQEGNGGRSGSYPVTGGASHGAYDQQAGYGQQQSAFGQRQPDYRQQQGGYGGGGYGQQQQQQSGYIGGAANEYRCD